MEKKDVDALIAVPLPEGRTLEYKESLGDLRSDSGRREFVRDVASFANTAGGTIYFGIKERRTEKNEQTGEPAEAIGLPDFNRETEVRRIENLVADGIEPRVSMTP